MRDPAQNIQKSEILCITTTGATAPPFSFSGEENLRPPAGATRSPQTGADARLEQAPDGAAPAPQTGPWSPQTGRDTARHTVAGRAVFVLQIGSQETRGARRGRPVFVSGRAITTARKENPRRANGAARDRIRARIKAAGAPCAICGRPIDYSLGTITDPRTGRKRPHPMSFVIDEIVPISRGGSPFSIENTRPAHWICNARRGDGTRRDGPTQEALPQPWEI